MARKGYWIAHIDVSDPEGYKAYIADNAEAFRKYRGRFLKRAGKYEAVEGACRPRSVVVEFPDYETALACYHSAEYQRSVKLRLGKAVADITVVEGYDGPQPAG